MEEIVQRILQPSPNKPINTFLPTIFNNSTQFFPKINRFPSLEPNSEFFSILTASNFNKNVPTNSITTSIPTRQPTRLSATLLPSKCHQNQTSLCTQSRTPIFQSCHPRQTIITQQHSLRPTIISHTLSPAQQSNNNNNFCRSTQFPYVNKHLIAIAQPNSQQNALFPLQIPFFSSGVAHQNCITLLFLKRFLCSYEAHHLSTTKVQSSQFSQPFSL